MDLERTRCSANVSTVSAPNIFQSKKRCDSLLSELSVHTHSPSAPDVSGSHPRWSKMGNQRRAKKKRTRASKEYKGVKHSLMDLVWDEK